MRKPVIFTFVTILLASGCASPAASIMVSSQTEKPAMPTAAPSEAGDLTIPATSLPATVTPTVAPLPTPTPAPVVFDRDGYRQFAVARSVFPGLWDILGERGYTPIMIAYSPKGNQIAISACLGSMSNNNYCEAEDSGLLIILDTASGELALEIPLEGRWPGGIDFTPDGKSLLYSTNEHKVALWDLAANQPGITFFQTPASRPNIFPWVAAAPDGSSYAAIIRSTMYVWDVAGNLLLETPVVPLASSRALAYFDDGSRLATGNANTAGIQFFDTTDWNVVGQIATPGLIGAALSPDGRFLVGAERLGELVSVWDVESESIITEIKPDHRVSSLRFNPAGDLLIVAGPGNLDARDGYSSIGTLYDTRNWAQLDTLYSFTSDGRIEFNQDGSRMAVLGGYDISVWEKADAQLLAGFETLQRFQNDLYQGDYAAAAQLFTVTELEADSLAEQGVKSADLAGSFEKLCDRQAIYCFPVKELVMMGYDYEQMVYLVRLSEAQGGIFHAPDGATIQYYYLIPSSDGQAKLIYLPFQ